MSSSVEENRVVTKGGFKFKRPNAGLSLNKPKPCVNSGLPTPSSTWLGTTKLQTGQLKTETLPTQQSKKLSTSQVDCDDISIVGATFEKPKPPFRDVNNVPQAKKQENIKAAKVQTSIMTFATKSKSVKPVAAVAPQRSPSKDDESAKWMCDEDKGNSNRKSASLSSMFGDEDEDLDDFDMAMPTGSPTFKKKLSQGGTKRRTPDKSPEKVSDSDDEEIVRPQKRRRTLEFSDSSDEEDNDNKNRSDSRQDPDFLASASVSKPGVASKPVIPVKAAVQPQNKVQLPPQPSIPQNTRTDNQSAAVTSSRTGFLEGSHPALKKESSSLTGEDLDSLRGELLAAMDEICDIILKVSANDLMTMVWQNYDRLQKLLSLRKQIKDQTKHVDLVLPRRGIHIQHRQNTNSNNIPTGLQIQASTPVHSSCQSAVSSDNSRNILPRTSTVQKPSRIPSTDAQLGSPFPCGDSFFESDAVFTQSHLSVINNLTKRNSLPSANVSNMGDESGGASPEGYTVKKPQSTSPHTGWNFKSKRSESTLAPSTLSTFKLNSSVNNQSTSLNSITPNRSRTLYNEVESDNEELFGNTFEDTSQDIDSLVEAAGTHYNFNYNLGSDSAAVSKPKEFGKACNSSFSNTFGLMGGNPDDAYDIDEYEENFSAPLTEEDLMPAIVHTSKLQGSSKKSTKMTPKASTSGLVNSSFTSPDKCEEQVQHPEYAGFNFAHSQEMRKVFNDIFGLRNFRHNQLEAVNAALLGNDCFILMPTGGGKSLCYQLPACVSGGVSIVVSPLRALIQDQVQKLTSMGVPAGHLSADVNQTEADRLYSKLYKRVPEISLLYVTPEKISASEKLMSVFENLYNRKLLARFVIDEAHCVSQWGHDFRPDYKKLSVLRQRFPGVAMMALTATATLRVRKDITHQLCMKNPKWFTQSFNRPNLKLVVHPKKPSTATADVIKIIKEKFPGKCGIVYCLSRNECDTVARELSKTGILAVSYHAGLSDGERIMIQEKWLNGNRCKVICATIAFGMGIDKPDVRFVIHYSLPKSVEGYYQEAGRAGRDGLLSHCFLFYTYSDVKRLRRIIDMDQNATFQSKRVHIDNLFQMVQYCENVADCRRSQLLQYFGDRFDRTECGNFRGSICDNCASKDTFQLRDVTDHAKMIVRCVRELTSGQRNCDFTLLHFVEIFKGSKNSRIMELGHDKLQLHGKGEPYSRQDAERLFRKLVIDGILMEELKITAMEHTACYIRLGRKANDLMTGKIKVELQVHGKKKKTEMEKIGKEPVSKKENLIEQCYEELVEMAKSIADEYGQKYTNIFPTLVLRSLAEETPLTVDEMCKIEGLTHAKILKFKADRFLDITTKYMVMVSTMDEAAKQEGQLEEKDSPAEWESHYFHEPTTSNTGRKRRRPFKRRRGGGKGNTSFKAAGGKKTSGGQSSESGWISKKKPNFGQFSSSYSKPGGYKKSTGGSTRKKTSQGTSSVRGAPARSLGGPGFMPAPQPRSFLSSGVGSFFG